MRPLLSALALCLAAALAGPSRAQEGFEAAPAEESEGEARPGSDSPEAISRARAREGFGPRKRAQAFLIPLDEKARGPTGRVALAIERALSGARQYDVVDLAKGLAADALPDQVAKAREARKKAGDGHEAFGNRKFPEAALRYKEACALFLRGLADSDPREQADLYLRLGTAQKLAGDPKAARDNFVQSVLFDPQNKLVPRNVDPAAEGPMLGARADVEAAGTGTLDVDARPAGAKVIVDGQFKGNSPARLELPIGKHLVRVERTGFYPQADLVEVKGGKDTPFSLTLQATPGASNLNQVIAGAVEEASRGTTGPQTAKLAEKFSLERVLIGSVSSHGMKVAVMIAFADPKQVKVLGKTDLLLVADGTDADQIEADTQSATRKLFTLDTEEKEARAGSELERATAAPAQPTSSNPAPAATAGAAAAAKPPPSYSGMMGAPAPAEGSRRPMMPGAAAPAPSPDGPSDDPGLVAKERKVAVPQTSASIEAAPGPGPADAPAPEKPASDKKDEAKDDKKKAKGIKGKSGTEKWGDD